MRSALGLALGALILMSAPDASAQFTWKGFILPCGRLLPWHPRPHLTVTGAALDPWTVELTWTGPGGTYQYQEVGGILGGSRYVSPVPLTPACNPATNPTLQGCTLTNNTVSVVLNGLFPSGASHEFVVKGPNNLCGTVNVLLPPATQLPATFSQVQTDISRAGRMMSISVSGVDHHKALAAGDGGGLFETADGGQSWGHVDSLEVNRINDVAFAPVGSSDLQVVLVAAAADARSAANVGGIWRSADSGQSWLHVGLPADCQLPSSAFDIEFLGASQVFVAADCGLLASFDLGQSWSRLPVEPLRSLVVRALGGATIVDVCPQAGGHRRSGDGGQTWGPLHAGPSCETPHALAASPLEADVLFATFGSELSESDDGGVSWTDLHTRANNERPVWVRTRVPLDGVPGHFDLYFPGRRTVCAQASSGQRCATDNGTWPSVPLSTLNHDINGIAFDPAGSCPLFMTADWGIFASSGAPAACALPGDWQHVGRASTGLNSLQIYHLTGQLSASATTLFFGTQDNGIWINNDASASGWSFFGIEGAMLDAARRPSSTAPNDRQLTYFDFELHAQKVQPSGGVFGPSPGESWTSATPPGNDTAPVLVSSGTYVQWGGPGLFLTQDAGANWSQIAALPASRPLGVGPFGESRLTRTPNGPALYSCAFNGVCKGLLLVSDLSATAVPRTAEVPTFDGINSSGLPSGLSVIFGNCLGFFCQPVYAPDPNDFRHLIAADANRAAMVVSFDAGQTWSPIPALNNLVTQGGTLNFTSATGSCQVHVIAFDPDNSAHVLVGTDQAGLMVSADGGITWGTIPGSTAAPDISSIFFDGRTGAIYVATYGRGLWKLTVDWNRV